MKKITSVFLASFMLLPSLAFATSGGNFRSMMGDREYSSSTPGSLMGRFNKSSDTGSIMRAKNVSGTVASVTGSIVVLTASNGTSYTVDASGAKIIRKFGASMQPTDIQTGDTLMVMGEINGSNINAKTIRDESQQQKNANFAGSVTAVNGSSFTLQTKNRGSQTVNTNASTVFKQNGLTSVSVSNLAVGQNVETFGVWDSASNTIMASRVTIIVKTSNISGVLTAISSTTLTVTASGTSPAVYTVDAANVKKVDRRYGASTDLSALQVGDILNIRGVINGSSVTAITVRDMSLQAKNGSFTGSVTAINGSSFTLQSKDRGAQTINTTSSTVFKQGAQAASISSLLVGQTVTVSGVWDRTNSNVTANRVVIKVASVSIAGTLSVISGTSLTVTASSTTYSVDASKAVITYKNARKGSVSILQINDQVQVRGQMVTGSTNITAGVVRDLSQSYVK